MNKIEFSRKFLKRGGVIALIVVIPLLALLSFLFSNSSQVDTSQTQLGHIPDNPPAFDENAVRKSATDFITDVFTYDHKNPSAYMNEADITSFTDPKAIQTVQPVGLKSYGTRYDVSADVKNVTIANVDHHTVISIVVAKVEVNVTYKDYSKDPNNPDIHSYPYTFNVDFNKIGGSWKVIGYYDTKTING